MNDIEYTLFIRGLEKLYGGILSEDQLILEQVEKMVYLAREMKNNDYACRTIDQELCLFHSYVDICWPNANFSINNNIENKALKIKHGQLSYMLCQTVTKADQRGCLPDKVTVWSMNGRVFFQITCKGKICSEGDVESE